MEKPPELLIETPEIAMLPGADDDAKEVDDVAEVDDVVVGIGICVVGVEWTIGESSRRGLPFAKTVPPSMSSQQKLN